MKILILNGSPRPRGNVSTMLDAMKQEAEMIGHEVTMLPVAELSVTPCVGCMVCRSKRDCALPEDDAHRVARMLAEADVLIVGAPCYWGNLPGQMKTLFDRMVYAVMREGGRFGLPQPLHTGKKAIIVATSSVPFPLNRLMHHTAGVVRAVKEILHTGGFKIVATVQRGGTKMQRDLPQRVVERCRKVVHKL